MIVKDYPIYYFSGKEGVYYDPEENQLTVFDNKCFELVAIERSVFSVFCYDIYRYGERHHKMVATDPERITDRYVYIGKF